MLFTVSAREFTVLAAEKENIDAARLDYFAPVMAALVARWVSEMDSGALSVLIWIAGRTLLHGKAADRISYQEFISGVVDPDMVHIAPLPMTLNTVKKHVQRLCDDGFLNIYHCTSADGKALKDARMFEIDCKKILDPTELQARNCRILVDPREISGGKSGENSGGRGVKKRQAMSNFDICPIDNIYINNIDNLSNNELDKSSFLSARCASPKVALKSISKNESPESPTPMLSTGRKKTPGRAARPAPWSSDKIADVLQTLQGIHERRQTERAAAAVAGQMTTKNVQSLIDKAMAEYLPELPRVIVSVKPLGVFKKRIASYGIKDIEDLIVFCVREWTTLAAQNRVAFIRNPDKARQGTPLPDAPSFTDLAYRLPYFIAAYRNQRAVITGKEKAVTRETAQEAEIKRLKARLAEAEQEKQTMIGIVRRAKAAQAARREETPPPAPRAARRTSIPAVIDDNWTPPEWEEDSSFTPSRTRRYGNGK